MARAYLPNFIFAIAAFCLSCSSQDDGNAPAKVFEPFQVPSHFPPPVYDFSQNPITQSGFELGRKLFYDTRLSSDGTISCGTCHAQVHAFADHGRAVSAGVEGRLGTRNSPALSNLAWHPALMWDGGINHIEVMPIAPLTDPVEMDMQLTDIVQLLNEDDAYRSMFKAAFGSEDANTQRMMLALTQFQGAIVSYQSKYDRWLMGSASLSENETEGMKLFEMHCASCHAGVLFTDFSYRNNGLDSIFEDPGRALITGLTADEGKFKVPSLRNIMLTNPYMHDGRFSTLQQVLHHYTQGIVHSHTLDPQLAEGIPLSESDRLALLAFLNTLTDHSLLGNSLFSEP